MSYKLQVANYKLAANGLQLINKSHNKKYKP